MLCFGWLRYWVIKYLCMFMLALVYPPYLLVVYTYFAMISFMMWANKLAGYSNDRLLRRDKVYECLVLCIIAISCCVSSLFMTTLNFVLNFFFFSSIMKIFRCGLFLHLWNLFMYVFCIHVINLFSRIINVWSLEIKFLSIFGMLQ